MNYTICLDVNEAGRLAMIDGKKEITLSTPNNQGREFESLFKSLKEGDKLELTFFNTRICPCCGNKLKEGR